MDPASVLGLTGACISITRNAVGFISGLSDIRTRYREADLNIENVNTQTDVLRAAADRLQAWLDRRASSLNGEERDTIQRSLTATRNLIERLRTEADGTLQRGSRIARWERMRFLWGQQRLDQYLVGINNQIAAVNIFLQTLNLPDIHTRAASLRSQSSMYTLNNAMLSASSICSDISSITSTLYLGSDDSDSDFENGNNTSSPPPRPNRIAGRATPNLVNRTNRHDTGPSPAISRPRPPENVNTNSNPQQRSNNATARTTSIMDSTVSPITGASRLVSRRRQPSSHREIPGRARIGDPRPPEFTPPPIVESNRQPNLPRGDSVDQWRRGVPYGPGGGAGSGSDSDRTEIGDNRSSTRRPNHNTSRQPLQSRPSQPIGSAMPSRPGNPITHTSQRRRVRTGGRYPGDSSSSSDDDQPRRNEGGGGGGGGRGHSGFPRGGNLPDNDGDDRSIADSVEILREGLEDLRSELSSENAEMNRVNIQRTFRRLERLMRMIRQLFANEPGAPDLAQLERLFEEIEQLLPGDFPSQAPTVVEERSLHEAARQLDHQLITTLLRQGNAVNEEDSQRNTPLLCVKFSGSQTKVTSTVRCLLEGGANVNAFSVNGDTTLHLAAKACQLEALELLIDRRPDMRALMINFNSRETALHRACASIHYRKTQAIKILLDGGANIHAVASGGITPLDSALEALELAERRIITAAVLPAKTNIQNWIGTIITTLNGDEWTRDAVPSTGNPNLRAGDKELRAFCRDGGVVERDIRR
ncbi:hypothetical protein G7Y89_g9305 [Cudoniella acicularis]|uniref:Ankyrin n=1 Tax=Cudoniella acicularis TaxID=354080 RepID=A0A8H4RHK3_9HELO|nr:hypothetical protein G7Y89_g9305 [Cudoniella acicularis]